MTSPVSFADYRDATTGKFNTSSWDWGDGMPDISGGLLYYVANGVDPIPYSDVVALRYAMPVPTIKNGDLVAFMIGDQEVTGSDQGTLCASAVAAQNVTGAVQGFAPDAKLIAVGNIYQGGFWLDIYSFASEGYDGIEKTGDEAMMGQSVSRQTLGSWELGVGSWELELEFVLETRDWRFGRRCCWVRTIGAAESWSMKARRSGG